MNLPLIYIGILNWNGFSDTSELLQSLFKITYPNYKVVIVDNNSKNYEAKKLNDTYGDKIQIIVCNENLGFSGGNNVGIKYCLEKNADYILLLNNDTIVEPNFLDILVTKFEVENKVGIVAPRINYYDEPEKIWSEGGKISPMRGSGFAYSDKLDGEVDISDRFVSFVSGCCMLIKKDVFIKVGCFDENYFLYTEDTDLCFRVKKHGFNICVTPASKIYHKISNSSKNRYSVLPLYYTTRNRLYFAKKNFPKIYFFTVIYILSAMILKSIHWLLLGETKNVIAIKNSFKDFFLGRMGKINDENYFALRNNNSE
jgi:GT2 family glycosyltransferase